MVKVVLIGGLFPCVILRGLQDYLIKAILLRFSLMVRIIVPFGVERSPQQKHDHDDYQSHGQSAEKE
jgi:hypothetical protein